MAARSHALFAAKLLLAALGLLIVAGIAGLLWLKTLDADAYRRALERELSALLGRAVTVGAVSFELSLHPTLSVRDLRIANPAWASRQAILSAAGGEARVDLAALWKGRVAIDAVRLDDVDLLLERDAEGAGNWVPGKPERDTNSMQLPDFATVALTGVRLGWKERDGSVIAASIDSAEATIVGDRPFKLQAYGSFRGAAMSLKAQADNSLQEALRHRSWRLGIDLAQQDAALALDLRLPSFDSVDGIELRLDARGEHLASWSGIAAIELPDWGPYSLSAEARVGPGKLDVHDLKLSLDGLPVHPSRLEIDSGSLSLRDATDTKFSAQGRIGEAAISLQASAGPWPQLEQAGAAAPITLNASLASLTLSAEGSLADADATAPPLAFHVQGDAMAVLRTITGVQRDERLPVDVAAQLLRNKDGYTLQAIGGQLIGVPLSGHLDYLRAPHASLTGALELGMLNLEQPEFAAFASAAGAARASASSAASAAGAASGSARSSTPGSFDRLETDLSLRIAGMAGLPFPVKDLSARLRWRDDALQIQSLIATLAGTRITADGRLRSPGGRTRLEGDVNIPLLDLGKLGGAAAAGSRGREQRAPMDRPLPLAALRALDAELHFELARIDGAPAAIEKVAAQASLQGGRLGIALASATIAGVPLAGSVKIDASGDAWRLDADAAAERIDLAALARTANRPGTLTGTMLHTQAQLQSQGKSMRELLANARLTVGTAPFSLEMPRDRFALTVDQVRLEAEPGAPLHLSAEGKAIGAPMALTISGGRLAELADPTAAWPRIEASLRSTIDGRALQVDASTGPLQRRLSLRELPLTIRATTPGASATLDGKLSSLTASSTTPLAARIEIADLAQAAKLFTAAPLPSLRVEGTGQLSMGDGKLAIDGLAAQLGNSDVAGTLRIDWRGRQALAAKLSSRLLDLRQWEPVPDPGQRPLLDRPIPVRELLAHDLQLQLRTQRLLLHRYDLAQVQLDGTLQGGLVQLSAQAAEGDLHGEMRFDARNVPGLALRLRLDEVDTRSLYTEASMPDGSAAPRLSMRAQVAGTGSTWRRMLETANGSFLLTAGPGTLPVQAGFGFERLAGNLLLALLPGRPAGEFNKLVCAAAHFNIANGIATSSDGIVLRLERMDVLGSGAANLTNGQILFGYRAVRRSFFSVSLLGLTSGIAQVTGTLSDPKVELDPSGVLLAGTAAWATAGVSLLAGELWRKFEATGDPCTRIADGGRIPEGPLETLLAAQPR